MKMSEKKFEDGFRKKIDTQLGEISTKLEHMEIDVKKGLDEAAIAGRYYWGDLNLLTCGSATCMHTMDTSFPLLPQLVLTPHLIVDLQPMPTKNYEKWFGVTINQLEILSKEGFITPNIYIFFDEGWKAYYGNSDLHNLLLSDYSRINCEWISSYLNRRYPFTSKKQQAEQFFAKQIPKISKKEERLLMNSILSPVESIDRLPAVYAHKFAYLNTIGRSKNYRLDSVCESIQEKWETTGARIEALKLLEAAHQLVIGAFTANYGGKAHYTRKQFSRFLDFSNNIYPPMQQEKDWKHLSRKIKHDENIEEQVLFCFDTMNQLSSLGIERYESKINERDFSRIFPLTNDQFKEFLRILKKEAIIDGWLSKFSNELLNDLVNRKRSPNLKAFRDIKNEVDSLLKPLPFIPDLLTFISDSLSITADSLSKIPPKEPIDTTLNLLFYKSSGALKMWAEQLKSKDYIPIFASSRNKSLCGQWKRIKENLKEQE